MNISGYYAAQRFARQNFPHSVTPKAPGAEARRWCRAQFGEDAVVGTGGSAEDRRFRFDLTGRWTYFSHDFYFRIETDAVWFKMRWG